MRVLVTGSRTWTNPRPIYAALNRALADARTIGETLTVVHGACKTGADRYAHDWCDTHIALGDPVIEDPHPANWHKHSKKGGPIRNTEMVNLGADHCHAFPRGDAKGTRDCAAKARAAGIPVTYHQWTETP